MDAETKQQELERLRARVEQLEAEVVKDEAIKGWQASGYYTAYYATGGFMLGMFGAMASLLFNVIGAPIAGKSPLELIRIYLTFPMGETALQLTNPGQSGYAVGDGVILAFGCCLYLATGMLLGIPVYLALTRFAGKRGLLARLIVATVVSLAIWGFNFYAILSWLQPLLIGGDAGELDHQCRLPAVVGRRGDTPGVRLDDRSLVSAGGIHPLPESQRPEARTKQQRDA